MACPVRPSNNGVSPFHSTLLFSLFAPLEFIILISIVCPVRMRKNLRLFLWVTSLKIVSIQYSTIQYQHSIITVLLLCGIFSLELSLQSVSYMLLACSIYISIYYCFYHYITLLMCVYSCTKPSSSFCCCCCFIINNSGISLIEWPSRLSQHPQLLPNPRQLLEIDIKIRPASDERVMTFKALTGSSWADRLQTLVTQGMVDDLMILL